MFDTSEVKIGRLHDNDVPLPDSDLIVGRRHVRLLVENGTVFAIDDDSKNGTVLNGEEMVRGKKYSLRTGDMMSVGLYMVETLLVDTSGDAPVEQHPVEEEQSPNNPFTDYVRTMANLIQQLRATYAMASPTHRDTQLVDALNKGLATYREEQVGIEISKALGMHERVVVIREQTATPVEVDQEEANYLPYTDPDLKSFEEWSRLIADIAKTNREAVYMQRMAIVDDVLLRAVDKMVKVPSRFKLEFLGHSFIPSGSRFPYHTCSVDDLKAYLYDRSTPYEEVRRRLSEFEEAVDAVLIHEVAMLDGYREGVQHGVEVLLDQLNPELIKKRATQEGAEMRTLGVFSTAKWLRAIIAAFKELGMEDRGILEKTVFRPGFIRGYLEKVESQKAAGY